MNFLDVLNTLTEDGVEFVIVGGVAARLHGSTRLTHDLDIVPNLEEESWPEDHTRRQFAERRETEEESYARRPHSIPKKKKSLRPEDHARWQVAKNTLEQALACLAFSIYRNKRHLRDVV